MAINLPRIEKSELTHYIPPKGPYHTFQNQEEYEDIGRKIGLFKKNPKNDFWFKGRNYQRSVKVIGYEVYGENNDNYTLVIEFEDGNLSCIHPAYLAEMQKSTFGKEVDGEPQETNPIQKASKPSSSKKKTAPKTGEPKKKEEKQPSIELPDEKVSFTATIKEFTTKPNPFSDNDDEIILLEQVRITEDQSVDVGEAWCGYSKTLKKMELEEGQQITFNAKIVKKKHKGITYKINNPSKVQIVT